MLLQTIQSTQTPPGFMDCCRATADSWIGTARTTASTGRSAASSLGRAAWKWYLTDYRQARDILFSMPFCREALLRSLLAFAPPNHPAEETSLFCRLSLSANTSQEEFLGILIDRIRSIVTRHLFQKSSAQDSAGNPIFDTNRNLESWLVERLSKSCVALINPVASTSVEMGLDLIIKQIKGPISQFIDEAIRRMAAQYLSPAQSSAAVQGYVLPQPVVELQENNIPKLIEQISNYLYPQIDLIFRAILQIVQKNLQKQAVTGRYRVIGGMGSLGVSAAYFCGGWSAYPVLGMGGLFLGDSASRWVLGHADCLLEGLKSTGIYSLVDLRPQYPKTLASNHKTAKLWFRAHNQRMTQESFGSYVSSWLEKRTPNQINTAVSPQELWLSYVDFLGLSLSEQKELRPYMPESVYNADVLALPPFLQMFLAPTDGLWLSEKIAQFPSDCKKCLPQEDVPNIGNAWANLSRAQQIYLSLFLAVDPEGFKILDCWIEDAKSTREKLASYSDFFRAALYKLFEHPGWGLLNGTIPVSEILKMIRFHYLGLLKQCDLHKTVVVDPLETIRPLVTQATQPTPDQETCYAWMEKMWTCQQKSEKDNEEITVSCSGVVKADKESKDEKLMEVFLAIGMKDAENANLFHDQKFQPTRELFLLKLSRYPQSYLEQVSVNTFVKSVTSRGTTEVAASASTSREVLPADVLLALYQDFIAACQEKGFLPKSGESSYEEEGIISFAKRCLQYYPDAMLMRDYKQVLEDLVAKGKGFRSVLECRPHASLAQGTPKAKND